MVCMRNLKKYNSTILSSKIFFPEYIYIVQAKKKGCRNGDIRISGKEYI